MSRFLMTSIAALLPLGLAFSAVAGGDDPETYVDEPEPYAYGATCDIRVVRDGGALVLEGLAFAPVPTAGSYDFVISQGGYAGRSNIRQGGDFDVGPGAEESLGMVSLSYQGSYDATLTVHWNDGAPDCTRRVATGRGL